MSAKLAITQYLMRCCKMSTINASNADGEKTDNHRPEGATAVNRRALLKTGAVAAGTAAGLSAALADTYPVAAFGGPVVEIHVPPAS
jgi:hypothetical protein